MVFQIGKTKVFLRAGQMAELDSVRNQVLGKSASKIQRKYRAYAARKSFLLSRTSAIQIQALCRGIFIAATEQTPVYFKPPGIFWTNRPNIGKKMLFVCSK